MRVLFVTNRWPAPSSPGDSPAIRDQADALKQLGHDVEVLFFDTQARRLSYVKAAWRVFWDVGVRGGYDLVHAHYGYLVGWVARMQWRRPVIVTFRGSDLMRPSERRISSFLARVVDDVIVMTREMKDILGSSEAHVIPYGIDLAIFKPQGRDVARQALGLPAEAPLILFPYRTDRVMKRFELVREATELLKAEFPSVMVLTIAEESNIRVAQYMAACDLMMLTSSREGAPVAIREALACNLPIVSVDVGDVADVIQGVEWCSIVNDDPPALAASAASILRSGERSNGVEHAAKLDIMHAAAAVGDVYDESLARRRRSRLSPVARRPRFARRADGER